MSVRTMSSMRKKSQAWLSCAARWAPGTNIEHIVSFPAILGPYVIDEFSTGQENPLLRNLSCLDIHAWNLHDRLCSRYKAISEYCDYISSGLSHAVMIGGEEQIVCPHGYRRVHKTRYRTQSSKGCDSNANPVASISHVILPQPSKIRSQP